MVPQGNKRSTRPHLSEVDGLEATAQIFIGSSEPSPIPGTVTIDEGIPGLVTVDGGMLTICEDNGDPIVDHVALSEVCAHRYVRDAGGGSAIWIGDSAYRILWEPLRDDRSLSDQRGPGTQFLKLVWDNGGQVIFWPPMVPGSPPTEATAPQFEADARYFKSWVDFAGSAVSVTVDDGILTMMSQNSGDLIIDHVPLSEVRADLWGAPRPPLGRRREVRIWIGDRKFWTAWRPRPDQYRILDLFLALVQFNGGQAG